MSTGFYGPRVRRSRIVTARWVDVCDGRVAFVETLADGVDRRHPIGHIGTRGVWRRACDLAGVTTQRWTHRDSILWVEMVSAEGVYELEVCDLSRPGWEDRVPPDEFAEAVREAAEREEEAVEAALNRAAELAEWVWTYRVGRGL